MTSRRSFLSALLASSGVVASDRLWPRVSAQIVPVMNTQVIDRISLVKRHNPVITRIDPLSALSVGNGRFAFTADVTGLQTLRQVYEKDMPLCTMSEWGWHSIPKPSSLTNSTLRLTEYDTYGRQVGYQTSSLGQLELFNWLRENPHRLHLGEIGLCRIDSMNSEVKSTDITQIQQQLDMWCGILNSTFQLDGEPVSVITAVHPEQDMVAVTVESKLIGTARLAVRFNFPYGSPAMQAADWDREKNQTTKIGARGKNRVEIHRALDEDRYAVLVQWEGSAELVEDRAHSLILRSRRGYNRLAFTAQFSPSAQIDPGPQAKATFEASSEHWRTFWSTGGCIDLSGSTDKRVQELERRIVLSQYLTAIQCSGRIPPQETGLTVNSWYGKFHLEMHWWHAAHFALWDRLHMLERSLAWYQKILPQAKELAGSQGYAGAHWGKWLDLEGETARLQLDHYLSGNNHILFFTPSCVFRAITMARA